MHALKSPFLTYIENQSITKPASMSHRIMLYNEHLLCKAIFPIYNQLKPSFIPILRNRKVNFFITKLVASVKQEVKT